MNTNADITLYNKFYDAENRQNIFLPTVIKGVSLYMASGSTGDNMYRHGTASYKIRIPIDADMLGSSYVDKLTYSKLDQESAAKHWTLQPDMIIIPAVVEGAAATADLTSLTKEYGDYITVTDFSDNRSRGIESMKHWRIGGE